MQDAFTDDDFLFLFLSFFFGKLAPYEADLLISFLLLLSFFVGWLLEMGMFLQASSFMLTLSSVFFF